ncbi:MAG: phenylalanine--tRNA ligase subunit beta [Acidobacteria bacterium]|nr:phenylalanine--tRNA ligase subunit beta [Acidobacteriota bacterium]
MKIPLSWLTEFVDLPESVAQLTGILDDLGLVVEGVENVGEGLEDVVVARIDAIRAIEGADRVRLVTVDAGHGPLEIVCGATNFAVGNHVPLAPVGAVLPGGFEIAARKMRGVTSNGMLCSARELGLSDDHEGLYLLDDVIAPEVGQPLLGALGVARDVVLDISVEGNRPDAWSVLGVARDLATRLGRPLRDPALAVPDATEDSSSFAAARIDDPDLCGRLTVSVLRHVVVGPSPAHLARRLTLAGMRPISNVVDASNLVMLELGQPTHPYDAAHVAGRALRARRARIGEVLTTLDGVVRVLAQPGRGLGDTGEDCVIVDGDDRVLGLAGIMGGAASEISATTTDVLLEAAFFDPMTIARSSKRHALRSEASNRFERGVDPELALTAVGRFVALLRESNPDVVWMAAPLDVAGVVAPAPTVTLRDGDLARALGVDLDPADVRAILEGLRFQVSGDGPWRVTAPSARLDVRTGAAGRADVIEEIARLYGYSRLPRRTPAWSAPGALSDRQRIRRRLRDAMVDLGVHESWTPTLGSDDDFDLLAPEQPRVRITNPLAAEESVMRSSLLVGLVRAWARNAERGLGDVMLGELGNVFLHPDVAAAPRRTRGGVRGAVSLALPQENERFSVVMGRVGDDARTAVATWAALAGRLGIHDVVVRSFDDVPRGLHPTRTAHLIERGTNRRVGFVGEVDPALVDALAAAAPRRRLGVLDLDLDVLVDLALDAEADQFVTVPSRYPAAIVDLAFVVAQEVHAVDLAEVLMAASEFVEDVTLFDVYRGEHVPAGARSLAYNVRFSSATTTMSEADVARARDALIDAARALGAELRS